MSHYICTGGCDGVSKVPGTCGSETCSKHNESLEECSCSEHNVPE